MDFENAQYTWFNNGDSTGCTLVDMGNFSEIGAIAMRNQYDSGEFLQAYFDDITITSTNATNTEHKAFGVIY